jgi:hypothetical protein
MADTGKQSPLGVNVIGSLLAGHVGAPSNTTFYINPVAESYFGVSTDNKNYQPGKIVNDTCLKWLTYALDKAYGKASTTPISVTSTVAGIRYKIISEGTTTVWRNIGASPYITGDPPVETYAGQIFIATGVGTGDGTVAVCDVTNSTYDEMLNIGQSRIPALGNSKPPTYQADDPSQYWTKYGAPANTGFAIEGEYDHGQDASWDPWDTDNQPNSEVTRWGWVRALALQAYNEFWWNAPIEYPENLVETDDYITGKIDTYPSYKDFTSSFLSADAFVDYSNKAITAIQNAQTFLQGTYSNQDDLITADISGVSLSARAFGQDLINLGKALELSLIAKFGLPSGLLQTLQKNNAITQLLNFAMLSAGLTQSEVESIANNPQLTVSTEQEQKLYGAFLAVNGQSLREIIVILNCKTKGLTTLADLLSIKKLFPTSYRTLTVPIYNTEPGPTNSKTYYLLFINDELNPQLILPRIKETVGTITPPTEPPVVEPPPPPPVVEEPENIIPPVIPQPPPPEPDIPTGPPPPPATVPVYPPPTPPPPATPQKGGGGGCVALESFVPLVESEQKHNGREITKAWMLESSMKISLGTEELSIVDGSVVKTLNDYQPCVRISTSDGITLVCSTSAPILTKDKGFIPATEVYGKRVAVMRNGRTWYDEVVGLEDVGMKFVRVIDAGNNSFWAGERPGAFILHHNVPINDKYNYDKK